MNCTEHQRTLEQPQERQRHPAFTGKPYYRPVRHVPVIQRDLRPLHPEEFCRATKRPRPFCCGRAYMCSELDGSECWKFDVKLEISRTKPVRCDECKKEFGP